ncbi:MAG: hypothetical protein ACTHK8_09730 [Ginsengibacter sp.]
MTNFKYISKAFICLLLMSHVLLACQEIENKERDKDEKTHKKKDKDEEKEKSKSDKEGKSVIDSNKSIDCDTTLWRYVYDPERLQIVDKCKTVTGIIEESDADEDGDQHMLLKLDKGQEDLLAKKNKKKKQGDLVIEAVCANKTTLKKVGDICNGYTNKIEIPKLGDHVKVTGSLVIDTHNGWTEIHPITKIERLK